MKPLATPLHSALPEPASDDARPLAEALLAQAVTQEVLRKKW